MIVTLLGGVTHAHNDHNSDVAAPGEIVFDLACASAAEFQRSQLDTAVASVVADLRRRNPRNPDTLDSCERTDVAFPYDLNGDGHLEYFIPLTCGCRGECLWGVFDAKQKRLLGSFWAEIVHIRKRVGRYAALTPMTNEDVSTRTYATYAFRRGRYRRVTRTRETVASRQDYPRELLNSDDAGRCRNTAVSTTQSN